MTKTKRYNQQHPAVHLTKEPKTAEELHLHRIPVYITMKAEHEAYSRIGNQGVRPVVMDVHEPCETGSRTIRGSVTVGYREMAHEEKLEFCAWLIRRMESKRIEIGREFDKFMRTWRADIVHRILRTMVDVPRRA